jgi:cell division protease FtsH
MTYGRDYSEDAATAIDEEVGRILDTNYDRAKQIIEENKGQLVKLAQTLINVETLDREEFETLMNPVEHIEPEIEPMTETEPLVEPAPTD